MIIESSGTIRCVYSEQLELSRLGSCKIRRGSHVEPTTDGLWTADLSPVHGPLLGPFANRSQALYAERDWLHEHWLPVKH